MSRYWVSALRKAATSSSLPAKAFFAAATRLRLTPPFSAAACIWRASLRFASASFLRRFSSSRLYAASAPVWMYAFQTAGSELRVARCPSAYSSVPCRSAAAKRSSSRMKLSSLSPSMASEGVRRNRAAAFLRAASALRRSASRRSFSARSSSSLATSRLCASRAPLTMNSRQSADSPTSACSAAARTSGPDASCLATARMKLSSLRASSSGVLGMPMVSRTWDLASRATRSASAFSRSRCWSRRYASWTPVTMKRTWSSATVLAIACSAAVRTASSFSPASLAFCQRAWMKS